jgi:hypothetical protein
VRMAKIPANIKPSIIIPRRTSATICIIHGSPPLKFG